MMTIEQMRSRKTMLGLTNEALAEKSGLPLGTVQKVLAGITKAPRHHEGAQTPYPSETGEGVV